MQNKKMFVFNLICSLFFCLFKQVAFVFFKETGNELKKAILKESMMSSPLSSSLLSPPGTAVGQSRAIRCEMMSGDVVKHTERQRLVDMFQRGDIDVLVLTLGVGSVGITLTKSHTVVLLDRPWTPGVCVRLCVRVFVCVCFLFYFFIY